MDAIRRPLAALIFAVIALGALISMRYLDSFAAMDGKSPEYPILTTQTDDPKSLEAPRRTVDISLNCSQRTGPATCPPNYYPSKIPDYPTYLSSTPRPSCPDYFRWIYEDLWPWKETGITREMVTRANRTANFHLVILNGKAYVKIYTKSFQSRDLFTLWGVAQLLRRYPGRVPDLELMFDCVDWPVIRKEDFAGRNHLAPPPLFRYCGNDSTYDIVFPDWSFWGWREINIKPWEALSKDLKEGNKRTNWTDREAYAYWKGNPEVADTRKDLLKCNVSDEHDWSARVYAQDWLKEQEKGFKQSNLASQCTHRYKIYIEGSAWSVSEKYILACDSVTLLVKPHYYDFFTRGLEPLKHYWPIKEDDKCRSIKHAVDWGNSHQKEAQAIGKAASSFILNDMKMDYVYDYMFHLLTEYAKLLKYKPTVPPDAVEVCSELMACRARGLKRKFMKKSLVKGPALSSPCTLPPPYDPASLHSVVQRRDDGIKQVESWEKEYWQRHSKQM